MQLPQKRLDLDGDQQRQKQNIARDWDFPSIVAWTVLSIAFAKPTDVGQSKIGGVANLYRLSTRFSANVHGFGDWRHDEVGPFEVEQPSSDLLLEMSRAGDPRSAAIGLRMVRYPMQFKSRVLRVMNVRCRQQIA